MHINEVREMGRKTAQLDEGKGSVVKLTPNFYAIYLLWYFDVSRTAGWEDATDG